MKSVLINLARAVLKLAIFLTLAVLLVKPMVVEIVSLAHMDVKQAMLSSLPQFLGMLCKILLICAGMILPYVVTKKIQRMRILSFVVGSALTILVYAIAQSLAVHLISLIAMLVTGVLAMLLVLLIGIGLFYALLYALAGPWGILLYDMYKDEKNKERHNS